MPSSWWSARRRPAPARCGSRWRRRPATTSATPARTSAAGQTLFEPGTVLGPGPPRRAGQRRRRRGRSSTRGPGRRAVDRRRAGRRPGAARARARSATPTGPRCWRWWPRPAASRSTSACVRDDEAAITAAIERGAATCDAVAHQRRRVDGRLRLREGGARPHRRDALDAGRDQAGQAAGVRHASAGHAGVRAARATRCRRW